MFDDPALAPLVLQKGLAVSAEELLRAPDTEARKRLASEAAAENWTPADARRAVKQTKWNESFQQSTPSPHLASRIRALREELAGLEPGTLSERARRELVRLLEVGWALTSRQRVSSGSALEDNRCVPR